MAVDVNGNGRYRIQQATEFTGLVNRKMEFFRCSAMARIYKDSLNNYNESAEAIAIGQSGSVYITGYSGSQTQMTTIKYNPYGTLGWIIKYNSPNNLSRGRRINVDNQENIYVSGESLEGQGWDFVAIKYSSSGVQQWKAVYAGAGDNYLRDIAVDNNGNVCLTGYSFYGYCTVKFNSSGVQQWAAFYSGSGYSDPTAIALDNSGNIYVTGLSDNCKHKRLCK
jgi:streptogramin lyase